MQNSALASMIKKKKHILRKKSLKNTFPQQKNTTMNKKQKKKHFCFLKTLAGRTGIHVKQRFSANNMCELHTN